eukprot:scaffold84219_cov34-Tisochrysis_lutea.AAC.5
MPSGGSYLRTSSMKVRGDPSCTLRPIPDVRHLLRTQDTSISIGPVLSGRCRLVDVHPILDSHASRSKGSPVLDFTPKLC